MKKKINKKAVKKIIENGLLDLWSKDIASLLIKDYKEEQHEAN